jgi:hypothetical protein
MGKAIMITLMILWGSAQAYADSRLVGLTSVHLLIEGLMKDGEACGITKSMIREAFMNPASSARFDLTSDDKSAAFYINVNTVRSAEGTCASNVQVQVYYLQNVELQFSKKESFVRIVLWQQAGLYVGGEQSEHAERVKQVIGDLTKHFIAEWNLANNRTSEGPIR